MTYFDEGNENGLQSALSVGLVNLARAQTVTFTQYTKSIIAADGYVFWVSSGATMVVSGSLHYGVDKEQNEDETIAINRIIFTAREQVEFLNNVAPTTLFIGTIDALEGNQPLQIAFSHHGSFYQQAGLWHYFGDVVYPTLQSQLINSASDLPTGPIVSNSLPIWLSLNTYAPVYPSFLVPDNLTPPYIVAHIEPEGTEAIQAFPTFAWPGVIAPGGQLYDTINQPVLTGSDQPIYGTQGTDPLHNLPSDQLMRDRVKLTLYGFTNQQAIQYYVSLIQYSLDTDAFGFMNNPAIRDEKKPQVEISALAMKKTIDIMASYYQSTADAIARRLLLAATVTTTVQPFAA